MKSIVSRALLLVLISTQIAYAQSGRPHIEHVEKGLLPSVIVKGNQSWTLDERMKHYKAGREHRGHKGL